MTPPVQGAPALPSGRTDYEYAKWLAPLLRGSFRWNVPNHRWEVRVGDGWQTDHTMQVLAWTARTVNATLVAAPDRREAEYVLLPLLNVAPIKRALRSVVSFGMAEVAS